MEDISFKTAQLVKLICEIGPDIPEIARRLGQFRESVRYRYKKKVLERGFSVQAAPNYEKLGLRRVMSLVEFSHLYLPYSNEILIAMNELSYLVYFAKTTPGKRYIIDAAVPLNYVEQYVEFINMLVDKGLFTQVETFRFDWARNPPMRAEFYDFNTGMWDFDWSIINIKPTENIENLTAEQQEFDYIDLLIIKELQIDANRSLIEIAKNVSVNYKKLAWHYTNHVLGRGLIKSYRVNWMGTRYDYTIEKALHRKHRYLSLFLIVKDTNRYETMELSTKMNVLPFLWFEAGGANYYANFAFPVDFVNEAFQYLELALENFTHRYELCITDSSNALTFTIPYKLYDQERHDWVFNRSELLNKFENLLIKIKEMG